MTCGGYNVLDVAGSSRPQAPALERALWYQYYFHGERGRAGLERYRRELALELWREWSPSRPIASSDFDAAAVSFDNPDFVDVVIHSYRHRFGLAPGADEYEDDERLLATQPAVPVPAIVLDPTQDPMVRPRRREEHAAHFSSLLDHRLIASGHNQSFDAPDDVARAVLDLHRHLMTDPTDPMVR